jgi:hypothetical protein
MRASALQLGDVLFDVLMMIEVSRRDHPNVTLEACCASACAKLERRAPYLFGAPAMTIAEAEAAWQAGKSKEVSGASAAPAAPAASAASTGTYLSPTSTKPGRVTPGTHPPQHHAVDPTTLTLPTSPVLTSPTSPVLESSAHATPSEDVPSCAREPQSPALPASNAARAATAIDGQSESEDEDAGLAEWENDFRRDAGPGLSSEDDLSDLE